VSISFGRTKNTLGTAHVLLCTLDSMDASKEGKLVVRHICNTITVGVRKKKSLRDIKKLFT
jgi:hypothetical protein